MAEEERPLRKISEAFEGLAATVNSQSETVEVEMAPFSQACSLVSPLFGCLGIAFKFAEMDYVSKVLFFLLPTKKFKKNPRIHVLKFNFWSGFW